MKIFVSIKILSASTFILIHLFLDLIVRQQKPKFFCPTMQCNTPIKKTNDTNYHDKLHRCSQLVSVNAQRFTPWLTTFTLCSVQPRGACKCGTFQNSDINNFDNSGGNEERGHIYMTRKKTVRNTNGGFKPQSMGSEILQKIGWLTDGDNSTIEELWFLSNTCLSPFSCFHTAWLVST